MADYDVYGKQNYMVSPRMSFAYGAAETVKTQTIRARGKLYAILLEMANFTNGVTGTLTVANQYTNELYNSTAKAENATYLLTGIDRIHAEEWTITLTLSGVPGGTGGTCYAIFYYEMGG